MIKVGYINIYYMGIEYLKKDELFKLLLFCCIVFIVSLYGSLFLSLMCIFYVVKVVGL